MPGTAPSLQFEHGLNAVKGWFEMAALDYDAPVAPAVTIILYSGRVLSLNANGEFETGISGRKMAIFAWPSDTDFDVSNPGTTPSGLFMHRAIAPTGKMSGLVAKGGYQLETTEFDKTPTAAYAPNQLLTAITANTTQATGGVISNDRAGAGGSTGAVRQYVDAACGLTTGQHHYVNEHGVEVLSFWPLYLPAAA